MIRPLSLFIGLRYLSTGRSRGLVSFMSLASLLGIALGVAAVIVILSAMNGLEAESRQRLLSMAQHVTVRPEGAGQDLGTLRARLATVPGVVSVSPYVSIEALLHNGPQTEPVLVRGIDPASERGTRLETIVGRENLVTLTPGSGHMLLGRFLAGEIGVIPGDSPIEIVLPDLQDGRFGIRQETAEVVATFHAGDEAYDGGLALMSLTDASRMIGLDGQPQGLAVSLDEPMAVQRMERALRTAAGPGYRWSNWATENASLFRAMRIEKTMMTFLLLIIVAVAAFNIVTSLTMVVNEKEKDIAILRTLGLEPGRVMRIFIVQGCLLGLAGTLGGVAIGLALATNLETILPWFERTFGFRVMPGDVFYVTEVPSLVEWPDLMLIAGFAFLIALAATIWPSRRAARVEPADVLRYE